MSYSAVVNLTLTNLTVTMFNVSCSNLVGSIYSFTCTLPTNVDSTPKLPAGIGFPKVYVTGFG